MNPLIANALYLSKNIESWGTGIKRVYLLCEENGVKIIFENEKFGYNFIFYRNNLCVDLSETEFSICSFIKANNKITTLELVEKIFKTPQAVIYNLKSLREKGYIKRTGSARYRYWEILK